MSLPEKPLTRRETYLAKAAGQAVTLPETDLTREEMYLRAIAESGGGGGTSPFYPAGNIEFANLPELSADILGAMYNVTDAFTTDSRFNEGAGIKYPAGTNVAVVNIGTEESPTLKFDTYTGAYTVDDELSDSSENPVQNKVITAALGNKADTSALNNYVEKEPGKSLTTNDYTDADKALVQNSPITVTATGAEITANTAQGKPNKLTVYGKSEVVDGAIKSAGEGWSMVDLGTLNWNIYNGVFFADIADMLAGTTYNAKRAIFCKKYTKPTIHPPGWADLPNKNMLKNDAQGLFIKDTDYETPAQFKAAMSGVILAYQLADPTQGNTIAVKTDNGSGINGTMATFTTGTPLRGIPDGARDIAEWDGSSGEVTKNCGKDRLADLTWGLDNRYYAPFFIAFITNAREGAETLTNLTYINVKVFNDMLDTDKSFCIINNTIRIHDTDYTQTPDFVASLGDAELVYELATPTTTPFTATENASFAALETYNPQTHFTNNANADMTVEAYAGTANGKAVQELKQDVQSEISVLKITQSDTLMLTTAGWDNNAQTVSYAHDTSKRNVIDVDPSSVEEWANCGVLATAETASGIMFTCKTVPENALNFRVTSMGV